jgi:hypothetical protein
MEMLIFLPSLPVSRVAKGISTIHAMCSFALKCRTVAAEVAFQRQLLPFGLPGDDEQSNFDD